MSSTYKGRETTLELNGGTTYAAVEPYISDLFAFVNRLILAANRLVKTATKPSFASFDVVLYNTRIEPNRSIAAKTALRYPTKEWSFAPEA